METVFHADEHANTLYTESDCTALRSQITKRWICLAIPCALLLAAIILGVCIRNQLLTIGATIAVGTLLIAGYDLAIRPLSCYARHLHTALHGRVRETELPFAAISDDISLVDGLSCRAVTCSDYDAKGRPYDRLFYFDSQKAFPDFQAGEIVRVVHYDLNIADIERV